MDKVLNISQLYEAISNSDKSSSQYKVNPKMLAAFSLQDKIKMETLKAKARLKSGRVVSVGDAHFVFNQDGIAEFPKHLLPLFELLQLHQPNQFELVVDKVAATEQEAVVDEAVAPEQEAVAPEQEAVVDQVVVPDETAQSDAAPKSKKGK